MIMWTFPSFFYNRHPDTNEKIPAISLAERIIAAAKSIIGQHEKAGNSGFVDPLFEKRMQQVGWLKFQAWCAYTVELIWKEAFTDKHSLYTLIDKLFSGSALATWNNFKQSKQFSTGQIPKAGAIAIFQHGRSSQGHTGVVVEVLKPNVFAAVEGNTNDSGGREGIEVADKIRKTGLPFNPRGLNLLGFIYPPEEQEVKNAA
jgi:hypothetical protein